jgi:GTP-binding protein
MKHDQGIENKIYNDTLKNLRYSHVVLCVIDAMNAFRDQDLDVARKIIREGRGMIIIVNKWDLV